MRGSSSKADDQTHISRLSVKQHESHFNKEEVGYTKDSAEKDGVEKLRDNAITEEPVREESKAEDIL